VECVSPRSTDEDMSADEQWRVKREVDVDVGVDVDHHVVMRRPVRRRRVGAASTASRTVYVDGTGTPAPGVVYKPSDVDVASTVFDDVGTVVALDAGASSPISTNGGDPTDVMGDPLSLNALPYVHGDAGSSESFDNVADVQRFDTLLLPRLPTDGLDATWALEPIDASLFALDTCM